MSAILSDPAPDTTMCFPDYSQSSADHGTLLVLCQHIGHQLDTATYHSITDIISQVTEVKVADKNGAVRSVRVKMMLLSELMESSVRRGWIGVYDGVPVYVEGV